MPHADAIRFALVGQPTDVNVWSLFDETGAGYANHALASDEYPRLYRLSIPAREFEPYVADGMPSAVTPEGDFLTAIVDMQPGLPWSDGSPLTAQDVAFTVNTALAFRLRYDWLSAYNPGLLDHAEALDNETVKFYFSRPFNVGHWQYGALQGPVVHRDYWAPKIADAAALLPSPELIDSLETARAEADVLQARVDADNAQLLTTLPNSETYNELSARVVRNQNELNSVNSRLGGLQDEYDAALDAARSALFALEDDGEPTFGPLLRMVQDGDIYTREVNTAYPFEEPNFDRAVYLIFGDVNSARQAYQNDRVDVSIGPNGAGQAPDALAYPTNSARFLVFNPRRVEAADPVLHQALSCILSMADGMAGQQWAYDSFVLPGPWRMAESISACAGLSREEKIQRSVDLLRQAGYSWDREPDAQQAGTRLNLPGGDPFPPVTLLTTSASEDRWRQNAAAVIEQQARHLGIPLTSRETDLATIRYSVYSTGDYDFAVLGWRLSEYPGYLCEWFQSPGPFAHPRGDLQDACESLLSTADLETARQASDRIQSILKEDLPFLPLYLHMEFENYRNVSFPFREILNGLSGQYGAPALAVPAP